MKQKCHYRNLEINWWKILKMKLDKIRLERVNWTQQAKNMTQQRVITTQINLWLQERWKTSWIHDTSSFSWRTLPCTVSWSRDHHNISACSLVPQLCTIWSENITLSTQQTSTRCPQKWSNKTCSSVRNRVTKYYIILQHVDILTTK